MSGSQARCFGDAMKLVRNAGADRVIDLIRDGAQPGCRLDLVSSTLSLFAFAELRDRFNAVDAARFLLPPASADLALLGTAADRAARNRLQARWLARRLAAWIVDKAEVRRASALIPQGAATVRDPDGRSQLAVLGSFGFSTDGLGLAPGNPLSLIQASETPDESALLSQWVEVQWAALQDDPSAKAELVGQVEALGAYRAPYDVYALVLYHLFANRGEALDEEQIVKSATGIRSTVVWRKLFGVDPSRWTD